MSKTVKCKCDMCGKKGTFSCPLCEGANYCCEKCQEAHWGQHSQHCNVEYLDDPSMAIAMPFDLVDEDDNPLNFRLMKFVTLEGENKTIATVLESEQVNEELIGEQRLVARMTGKLNPGKGRPPKDAEKGENVTMTVKFVDKKTKRTSQATYNMKLPDDMIYDGNPSEMVKTLVSMKRRSRERGIVLWENLENSGEAPMRITTNGEMTIVVKRANKDEYTIKFLIRNIHLLTRESTRKLSRFTSWLDKKFRTGVTGRNTLKAKGLTPTSEHKILSVQDKSISSGMEVVFVLRVGDGNFAEPVDFEVYIPDNMPATKDTDGDVDAEINVENAVIGDTMCFDGEIDDITALCMCLNDNIAQNNSDLLDFELDENDELHQEIKAEISKLESLKKLILPYQVQLENDSDAEISHQVQAGIAEASELVAIGGKFRQIRWSKRISRGGGMGWAEDKVENWLPSKDANLKKLKDLYKALSRAGIKGRSDSKRKEDLLIRLESEGVSGATTPWTSKAKKKFGKLKDTLKDKFGKGGGDDYEEEEE